MTKVEVEIHDDLITVVNKIKDINDSGIELFIPEGSVLLDNVLNLKLVKQFCEKNQKELQFSTQDERGIMLISMLDEGVSSSFSSDGNEEILPAPTAFIEKKRRNITLPKIQIKKGLIPILAIVLILIGAIIFLARTPKAYTKIVVNSQPLTRSVTIKVSNSSNTNIETKILKGTTIETTVEESAETPATGKKIVGEKAKGNVTIYNNTDEDIKLKKGTTLNYEDNDEDFTYITRDEITIDKRSELDPDPDEPGIKKYKMGENTVDIEATTVGEDYNIGSSETLSVKGYKSSQMTAKTSDKIKGGKSEEVNVVAEEDKKTLSAKLIEDTKQKAAKSLQDKVGKSQKLVAGSVEVTITKETYSHNVGDETENLTLNATAVAKGLAYTDSSLKELLDKLVVDLVPEGYVLSEQDRETSVQPLGNSTNSVLNATNADIQVTLKTFIVADVNSDKLKNELKGKSASEAEKILGSIKNIKTYEFNISPSIPLLKKVPNDLNRIEVVIENE